MDKLLNRKLTGFIILSIIICIDVCLIINIIESSLLTLSLIMLCIFLFLTVIFIVGTTNTIKGD